MTATDVRGISREVAPSGASNQALAVSQTPTVPSPSQPSSSVIALEMLKARMSEASGWVTHIVNASALFAALGVGLFKFALDANATPQLRKVLCLVGIATSFGGFFGCSLMERLRRENVAEQRSLLLLLESNLAPNPAGAVRYATLCAAIAMVVNLIAWIYLLATTR